MGNNIAMQIIPSLYRLKKREVKVNCQLKIMRLAVLLKTMNLHDKSYPESINAISGDWTDRFTGKPIQYQKQGKGFRLFSPGADGIENPPPSGSCEETDDIIWESKR